MSSPYFTVPIACPILKSPNPSTASLGMCSLCKLNKIGDKQRPGLIRRPAFLLLCLLGPVGTATLCTSLLSRCWLRLD